MGIATNDDDDEDDIKYWLVALANKSGVEFTPEFIDFIENEGFDCDPDLKTLFDLSQWFNDGHNLKAIAMEAAYTCSKPRLFEFGGRGQFIGKQLCFVTTSAKAIGLGEQINDALSIGDIAKAGELMGAEAMDMLNSVLEYACRDEIAKIMAQHLLDNKQKVATDSLIAK